MQNSKKRAVLNHSSRIWHRLSAYQSEFHLQNREVLQTACLRFLSYAATNEQKGTARRSCSALVSGHLADWNARRLGGLQGQKEGGTSKTTLAPHHRYIASRKMRISSNLPLNAFQSAGVPLFDISNAPGKPRCIHLLSYGAYVGFHRATLAI